MTLNLLEDLFSLPNVYCVAKLVAVRILACDGNMTHASAVVSSSCTVGVPETITTSNPANNVNNGVCHKRNFSKRNHVTPLCSVWMVRHVRVVNVLRKVTLHARQSSVVHHPTRTAVKFTKKESVVQPGIAVSLLIIMSRMYQ